MWTLEPLALHRVRVPGPEVLFQRGFGETIELVIYAFVLRQGSTVCLVDTGLPPDYTALNRDVRARKGEASGFVDIGEPLPQRLRASSVKPDLVLLTSFGSYATGNLDAFAGIPLYASSRGCADLDRPEEPAMSHPLAQPIGERLRAARRIEHEMQILPGLTFLEVGIHHPASAALLVETIEGVVALADPVFTARNLSSGTALGAAEYSAGWHSMVRSLGRRCEALIPIHDPDPAPVPRSRWHSSLTAAAK